MSISVSTMEQLQRDTGIQITRGSEEWLAFLKSASRIYKYPFKDQLLIYAQRPDASACASIELWNKTMRCWVNKGAKGIALLDNTNLVPKIKYVFDVSDVTPANVIGRIPIAWELKEGYQEEVAKHLELNYGYKIGTNTFASYLSLIADEVAKKIIEKKDIFRKLQESMRGSELETVASDTLLKQCQETIKASVLVLLHENCLANKTELDSSISFPFIHMFNTKSSLQFLGNYINRYSKELLIDIGKKVREIEIDNLNKLSYNVVNTNIENKRSDDNGIDISKERRLLHSRFETRSDGNPKQIRSNETNLSNGAQTRDVRDVGDRRGIVATSHERANASDGDERRIDEADGNAREHYRGIEASRPDAMGAKDEQSRSASGGDYPERRDLSVKKEMTGIEEEKASELDTLAIFLPKNEVLEKTTSYAQLSLFSTAEEQLGEILIDQAEKPFKRLEKRANIEDEIIDNILMTGGAKEHSSLRIYGEYLKGKAPEKIVDFLKHEFRTGGKGFTFHESPISTWFDEKGLRLSRGNAAKYDCDMVLSWKEVEERIRILVMKGQFINRIERVQVEPLIKKELANKLYFFFRERIGEMPKLLKDNDSTMYSDVMEKLEMEILTSKEQIAQLQEVLITNKRDAESGKLVSKRNLYHDLEELSTQIEELKVLLFSPKEFQLYDTVNTPKETFITQDEIDWVLADGSSFQNGKKRIYEFYETNPRAELNDIQSFLKKEYGIGGRTHALPGRDGGMEDHSGKGIELSKGCILKPDSKVLIPWNKVAQRLRLLIQSNRYFRAGEKESYEIWKEECAQDLLKEAREQVETTIQKIQEENLIEPAFDSERVNDIAHRNYKTLQGFAKEVLDASKDIMQFTAGKSFMPLTVERIGGNRIAISHYYEQNGDAMADPDMEFEVDMERELLLPRTYQQDNMGIWQNVMEQGTINEELEDKLSVFAASWMKTIKTQGYQLEVESISQEEPVVSPELFSEKEKVEEREKKTESKGINFCIIDHRLGQGTLKEKYNRNVLAIQSLKEIESQERIATKEEQEILSQYVGWGGLSDVFDESKTVWTKEWQELKEVLTKEEYVSARESTLNAHYTQPIVIKEMYATLERMGFEKGNILEPAMGVGNFFGMLPESMTQSKLYGTELDDISGRIAKQLYPEAQIKIQGFEKNQYPNDFFDVAIGNVPFGNYQVVDKQFAKYHFMIHDYFFGKSLDQVRPGGVVAFITSKGTMDKENNAVRKFLSQRAELLGAVRLPNTAFKRNAGTEVTSDIIFLKKRDRIVDIAEDWVYTTMNDKGLMLNQYFVDHPEQIVGQMQEVSGPYGMETTCVLEQEADFEVKLSQAMANIKGVLEPVKMEDIENSHNISIPADPNIKNYSYTLVEDTLYYRENSIMRKVEVAKTREERIKGLVNMRDIARDLIDCQLNESSNAEIRTIQEQLNQAYDTFTSKYGLINAKGNKQAFEEDNSYYLLSSLEHLNEEGALERKADMFSKRTISRQIEITTVDTASEALTVSLQEKAKVDLSFMSSLSSKSQEDIIEELQGVIFKDPIHEQWESADAYLSGNIREKLRIAKEYAENEVLYQENVSALSAVMPKDLSASEIEVRLGATWIAPNYIEEFMMEVLRTPKHIMQNNRMIVQYFKATGQWNISGKNMDTGNSLVRLTYGTKRINAYEILQTSLNLKDVKIFDRDTDDEGREKRVLNAKETMIAQQKQEAIKEAFQEWIFKDQNRREELCNIYNKRFNSTRAREYNGSHLIFPGMCPEINLNAHQKNAVARGLYGGNSLLAHCVGAGKTYTMTAIAMECKRLGLSNKPLFVVPNHLTEQWANEFLRLYPGANILAATKKDFTPDKRKRFCSRIATGEYDAVIIGHTQFEKIPLSVERQTAMITNQIQELTENVEELKREQGERYTIKQLEKMKKSLSIRLEKLNDTTRKDDVVTFEQLGVDRIFVDESHNYKNLFLYTKMRNVSGIAQTEAQKSSDMYAKCQYMDELTGGKGVIFATGTPISNSMTELYTNMRYLQSHTLEQMGLSLFDSWASSFGETVTAIELAPEGTGYRAKTRFSKFFNLPELITVFKESADIQTADMLQLPVPEVVYHDEVTIPSEYQKKLVESLAERAEAVRNRTVEPQIDNMLKITSDGRKLALDQRLMNDMLPADVNSKTSICVERAFALYEASTEVKGTQLIFSDLSTPKGDGTYNVYEDIRDKLIEKGVPELEIAFIHSANTDKRKADLFANVRSGQVRFLLGSTQKMGAGTNVQDRLVGVHHLDVPWRPSDIEQREGRIIRQGNRNKKVNIHRYITEGTFDAYSWQIIENKQKFISQIMTSKSPVRSADDLDEASLSYAEIKALATGNPHIKEKMDLDIKVAKMKLLKANYKSQIYSLEDDIAKNYPNKIKYVHEVIKGLEQDILNYQQHKPSNPESFFMEIGKKSYTERKDAGLAILEACKSVVLMDEPVTIGEYAGFSMGILFTSYGAYELRLKGQLTHKVELSSSDYGNVIKISNVLEGLDARLVEEKEKLENYKNQLENAKSEVVKAFPKEAELQSHLQRLQELNTLLNMEHNGEPKIKPEVKNKANMQKGR